MKPTETRRVLASLAVMLLVVGSLGAQEEVSVLGMAWTPTPAPALVVSASGPLPYREVTGEGGVWTLEFPKARLAQPVESLAEPQAGLRRATLATHDSGVVSLILELAPGVQPMVRALPAGVEVRLSGREKVAASQRGEVEVIPAVEGETVTVFVKGLGPVAGKAFALDNPPRVAVDIPGVLPSKARRVYPVGTGGVQRVRVAQFAVQPEPVVRVAIDLDASMKYAVESTGEGLVVRLGSGETTVAASASPLPEVVTPVAVTEEPVSPATAKEPTTPEPVKVAEAQAPTATPAPPAPAPAADVAVTPPVAVAPGSSLSGLTLKQALGWMPRHRFVSSVLSELTGCAQAPAS
ncbi:MAG: AMIN domain-containing protein, partial [Thermoanaerobaculum sp.]